jgi:hypothetical protein
VGFPFVDAYMCCLDQHSWLNFRMRAMIVSFATYNLELLEFATGEGSKGLFVGCSFTTDVMD